MSSGKTRLPARKQLIRPPNINSRPENGDDPRSPASRRQSDAHTTQSESMAKTKRPGSDLPASSAPDSKKARTLSSTGQHKQTSQPSSGSASSTLNATRSNIAGSKAQLTRNGVPIRSDSRSKSPVKGGTRSLTEGDARPTLQIRTAHGEATNLVASPVSEITSDNHEGVAPPPPRGPAPMAPMKRSPATAASATPGSAISVRRPSGSEVPGELATLFLDTWKMLFQQLSDTAELNKLESLSSLYGTPKAEQQYQAQVDKIEHASKQLEAQSIKLETLLYKNRADTFHKVGLLEEDFREIKSKMTNQRASLSRLESSEVQGSSHADKLEVMVGKMVDARFAADRQGKEQARQAKESAGIKLGLGSTDASSGTQQEINNSHSKANPTPSEPGPTPSELKALKDEFNTFKQEIRAGITTKDGSKSKITELEKDNAALREEVAGLQETVKSLSQSSTVRETKSKKEFSTLRNRVDELSNVVTELKAAKVNQKAFTTLEDRVNLISSNSGLVSVSRNVNELRTEVKAVTEDLNRIKKDQSPPTDPRTRTTPTAAPVSRFPAVEKQLESLVQHVQHLPGPERFAQMEKDIESTTKATQWQGQELERHEDHIERFERDLKADNTRINEVNEDIRELNDSLKDLKSKVRHIDRDLQNLEEDVEARERIADDNDSTKVNSLGGQWSARQSETQKIMNTMKVYEEAAKASSKKYNDVQARLKALEEKQIPLQNDVKANSSTSKDLFQKLNALKSDTDRILHGSEGATPGLVQQCASIAEQLRESKNTVTAEGSAPGDGKVAALEKKVQMMSRNLETLRIDFDGFEDDQIQKVDLIDADVRTRVEECFARMADRPTPSLEQVMAQSSITIREEMHQMFQEAAARSTPPRIEEIENAVFPKLEQSTSRMLNEKMAGVEHRLTHLSDSFEFFKTKYPAAYEEALADLAQFSQHQGKISQIVPAIRNAARILEARYDNISTRDVSVHILNTLLPNIGQQLLQPIAKSVMAPLTEQIVPLVQEHLRPQMHQMQTEFNNMRQRIEGASQSNTEIANRNQLLRESQQQLQVKLEDIERRVTSCALINDTMLKESREERDVIQKRLNLLDQAIQRTNQEGARLENSFKEALEKQSQAPSDWKIDEVWHCLKEHRDDIHGAIDDIGIIQGYVAGLAKKVDTSLVPREWIAVLDAAADHS